MSELDTAIEALVRERMKERPILFSAPMVRAILAGTKAQTRRVMSPQPSAFTPSRAHETAYFDAYCSERKTAENPRGMSDRWCWWTSDGRQGPDWIRCPYGVPGDRLWVRETWAPVARGEAAEDIRDCRIEYRADTGATRPGGWDAAPDDADALRWRPSIHMPRWASRITLEIASVRVERLTSISEEDARAEGVDAAGDVGVIRDTGEALRSYASLPELSGTHRGAFAVLWDAINGERPGCAWRDDPWVWVIGFKRASAGGGA